MKSLPRLMINVITIYTTIMHTILGSTGITGIELAKHVSEYTSNIRLVSRRPQKVNDSDELMAADLMDAEQTLLSIAGSEVVYLTVGLPYKIDVWQEKWPRIMRNVIDGCVVNEAKLLFLDNIYPLGKVEGNMTEDLPMNPTSKKGEVRKKVDMMMLDALGSGKLQGLIAKAADFYGPKATTSVLNKLVLDNLAQGKKAQWLGRDDIPHSFTYTPDIGKSMALLGQTSEALGQIWHLPTASPAPTGKDIFNILEKIMGQEIKYTVLKPWMVRLAGIFNSEIKEVVEMMYQNKYPYTFDSSKFENTFNFVPTSYEEGLTTALAAYQDLK